MNFESSNIALYLALFLGCISITVIVLKIQFSKLKKKSDQHLALISERIESQQKLHFFLNNKVDKVKVKEKEIQQKMANIRFEMVQIEYSYHELLRQLIVYSST